MSHNIASAITLGAFEQTETLKILHGDIQEKYEYMRRKYIEEHVDKFYQHILSKEKKVIDAAFELEIPTKI